MHAASSQILELPMVHGRIEGVATTLILDTACNMSVIPLSFASKHNLELESTDNQIRTANDEIVRCIAITKPLEVDIENTKTEMKFLVLERKSDDILLGIDFFHLTNSMIHPSDYKLYLEGKQIQLISRNGHKGKGQLQSECNMADLVEADDLITECDWQRGNPTSQDKQAKETAMKKRLKNLPSKIINKFMVLYKRHEEVFAEDVTHLRACKAKPARIMTIEGCKPVRPYPKRWAIKEVEECETIIQELLKEGIIVKSMSSWGSIPLTVYKIYKL